MAINIDDLICDDTGVYFYENNEKVFVGVPDNPLKAKLLACSNGKLLSKVTGEYYKPCICRKGYERVTLYINRKAYTMRVHRLIATAFLPNPDNLPQVNHKDGDKQNNRLDNLEWISNRDNMDHAIDNDLTGNRETVLVRNLETGEVTSIYGIGKVEKLYNLPTRVLQTHLKSKRMGMYDFDSFAFKRDDSGEWPPIIGPYPGFIRYCAVDLRTNTLHVFDELEPLCTLTGIADTTMRSILRGESKYKADVWKIFKRCKM
jgi:hypothetical protein